MTTAAETVKQEEPIKKLDWDYYIIAEAAICYPPCTNAYECLISISSKVPLILAEYNRI